MTNPIAGLSDEHYAELSYASAIDDDITHARGYQTMRADQLPSVFAGYQRRDGLLIPLRTVRGEIESYQLKPHQPRTANNGKPIKYETAANALQVIDVPSQTIPNLGNPQIPLIITEGAKKVDAAISAGWVSVIGLQGVYGWRGKNADGGSTALADWESIALNNREVLIAFDSDVMSKESVRGALDRLAAFLGSKKARVNYLLMPNLEDGSKCGLDDWFALGKTGDELNEYIVDELPVLSTLSSPVKGDPPADGGNTHGAVVLSMREIESKPIDWLWPNWLPRGMLTLLGGYAGDGKSTLTMSLVATLSNGGILPDGTQAQPVNTLLLAAEDDLSHVVKPRLEVHNANIDNIHVIKAMKTSDGDTRSFNLRHDIAAMHEVVVKKNIGLVIIDPLSSYLANGDRNNEGDVRDTLQPLNTLMESTGCAVLGIMHIGKTDGRARSFQNLMGSTAFTALARCVWMVNKLPDDFQLEGSPARKVLGVEKSNYSVPPASLMFHRPQDGPVEFLGESPVRIDESFTWKSKVEKDKAPTETEKAEEWLLEFMDGERVLASEVEAAARAEGFKMSTVRIAKKHLGVEAKKEGSIWVWIPSDESANQAA